MALEETKPRGRCTFRAPYRTAFFASAILLCALSFASARNDVATADVAALDAAGGGGGGVCSAADFTKPDGIFGAKHCSGPTASSTLPQQRPAKPRRVPGRLRPADLPQPEVYTAFVGNVTVALPGKASQIVLTGSVKQINQVDSAAPAAIAVLPKIVDRGSVQSLLRLLRAYGDYDQDPDTVDGMSTHEIFVDSPTLGSESMKVLDSDPAAMPARLRLRKRLRTILTPLLEERLTPFVQQHYQHVCNSSSAERSCTPCYSLIRRYRHGERQSHAAHYDGHALITVVVSLSTYGTDHLGGLYVSTGHGPRQFLALHAGDAVAHQSALLHGVQVYDAPGRPKRAERWSWIVWYRDSRVCADFSREWYRDCADAGDAVCQELHAAKVGAGNGAAGAAAEERATQVLELHRAAAEHGNAAVKMARACLKLLPSAEPYNATEAARYYRLAMASRNPDGHYGMAILHLMALNKAAAAAEKAADSSLDGAHAPQREQQQRRRRRQQESVELSRVVWYLEEAASLGHAFAMFNLCLAHVYGYGMVDNRIDIDLGVAWCVQSGLPEGYAVAAAAHQAAAATAGGTAAAALQQQYQDRAAALGYHQPWRREARWRTGSGGAGGVDLNLPWPAAPDGRRPPVV